MESEPVVRQDVSFRRGRPRMFSEPMVTISVRMQAADADQLARQARKEGTSLTAIARRMLVVRPRP